MRKSMMVAGLLAALGGTASAAGMQPVELKFLAEVGGKPFSCDAVYEGVGATRAKVRFGDFRLYLSEIALVREDGQAVPVTLDQDGKWQYRDVAFLDFETGGSGCKHGNPETNTMVRGTVPEGKYKGLRFTIGVPFDLNHDDPAKAPPPLNVSSMLWVWQAGARFIRMEISNEGFVPEPAAAPKADGAAPAAAPSPVEPPQRKPARGWAIHIGSTQCASATNVTPPTHCVNPNRMQMQFADFEAARNVIVIDPVPALADSDVTTNTQRTASGCMAFPGDPECATFMPKLGLPYDGVPAQEQQLVRVR